MIRHCGRWPRRSPVRWPSSVTYRPNSATTWPNYLATRALWKPNFARQGELRTLTRKYAADIDGVLQWARESRERLAQLDVSEEALADLERRVDELEAKVVGAASEITKVRTKAAKGFAKAVTAELAGLAMADAEFTVSVAAIPAARTIPRRSRCRRVQRSTPGTTVSTQSSSGSPRTGGPTYCL